MHVCVIVATALAFIYSLSFSLLLGALAVPAVTLLLRGFLVRLRGALLLHLALALSIPRLLSLRLCFARAFLLPLPLPLSFPQLVRLPLPLFRHLCQLDCHVALSISFGNFVSARQEAMKPGVTTPFPLATLVAVEKTDMAAKPSSSRNEQSLRSRLPLTTSELIIVLSIFSMFTVALVCIYFTMPSVDHKLLKLPRTVAELRTLTDYVSKYTDNYKPQVLLGYCTIYIFMQTFMIPGTIVMSLLAGSLFGVAQGMALVIFTATAGASCCYFLSKLIGRPLAMWLWPDKLRFFTREVAKRRNYLFNYMLFLRVTPTLPNTFINVCSPIVDIPYPTFLVATILGLVPATFVTVRAGLALNTLRSFNELYDVKTVAALFVIGLVSIVPAIVSRSQSQVPDRPHSS